MPRFISNDVAKQFFDQKKRKSFNSDKQYKVPQKHLCIQLVGLLQKQGWWNVKNENNYSYSTFGVCGHSLVASAYSSSLTLFVQSLQKDRHK